MRDCFCSPPPLLYPITFGVAPGSPRFAQAHFAGAGRRVRILASDRLIVRERRSPLFRCHRSWDANLSGLRFFHTRSRECPKWALRGKNLHARTRRLGLLRMCSDPKARRGRIPCVQCSLGALSLSLRGVRRMSVPFEERSGVVPCVTPWGQWYQTLEEVFIEVQVPPGTRAQDIQCRLQSRHVALAVGGREILKGKLFDSTIADEGTWTLEDRKMVRIVLTKTKRDAAN